MEKRKKPAENVTKGDQTDSIPVAVSESAVPPASSELTKDADTIAASSVDEQPAETLEKPDLLGFTPDAPEPLPPAKPPASTLSGQVFVAAGIGGLFAGVLVLLWITLVGPLSDLGERVAQVENGMAGAATRRASEANEKRILALEGRVDALRSEVETRPADTTSPDLQQKLTALEQAVAAANRRVEGMERAATNTPATLGSEASQLSLAVLLRERVETGTPFSGELAALATLGMEPQRLEALQPFATGGAPTSAKLAQQFDSVLPALRKSPTDASPRPESASGWTERLNASLAGAIRITRSGESASATPSVVLDQIGTALKRGNAGEAANLWNQLPEPTRAAGAGFGEALAARTKATQAADALVSFSVEKLTRAARTAQGATR